MNFLNLKLVQIFIITCIEVASLATQCPKNEQEEICGKMCENTCIDVLIRAKRCVAICEPPACSCKRKFVRHLNGTCVGVSECPITEFQCQENEIVNKCGDSCDKNCDDLSRVCVQLCRQPACVCREGFARKGHFCRPVAECTKEDKVIF